MDRGEDQIVFVEQRHAGLVAGGVRRIEGELGQKTLARRIARRRSASSCSRSAMRIVASSWMRSRCGSYQRRTSSISAGQAEPPVPQSAAAPATKSGQSSRAPGRRWDSKGLQSARDRPPSRRAPGLPCAGPTPGKSCSSAEAGDAVARVLAQPESRQHVLHMGAVEEFQAAEFDERDVAAGQLHFERPAVMRRAEQNGLRLQVQCQLRGFPER